MMALKGMEPAPNPQ